MPDSPNVSESNAAALLEDYLTLSEAAKRLPRMNGRRVNTSTLWRWCRRGVRGIHLEYRKIGRSIVVREVDMDRFFSELAKTDKALQTAPPVERKRSRRTKSAARQQAIQEANDVLLRAGILKPQSITTL